MAILNYTTSIDPNKTVGEIQAILARARANQISVDYEDGNPTGLRFSITFAQQQIHFRLPCNVDGVYKSLERAKVPGKLRSVDQARRVAWRIIKDWVEAQLAIVEAGQAEMTEAFMPYVLDTSGQALFQMFSESKMKQLSQ